MDNRSCVWSSRKRLIVWCVFSVITLAVHVPESRGQGGDFVDGAVWQFTMVAKTNGNKVLKGQYRIFHHVVFQKYKKEDENFEKQVGRNFPNKGKTRLVFTDFRAADRSGTWHKGMKGTARLSMDKYGKWSGLLTDGKGQNWKFSCSRIKE